MPNAQCPMPHAQCPVGQQKGRWPNVGHKRAGAAVSEIFRLPVENSCANCRQVCYTNRVFEGM
jgi:hypothetical protein